MDGYQPYGYLTYVSGRTEVVNADLIQNAPLPGLLDIRSVPDHADVYIDGTCYGNAPMVLGNLRAGSHELVVRKAGYYDMTENIPIINGQTFYYNAFLFP